MRIVDFTPETTEQSKSNLKVTSSEDAQHVSRRQASPNGTAPSKGDARGSRTVPRRHTLGGARGSREILAMQPPDMDKKREAFLEHLKQKYPHHASAIMGHQERLREQSRKLAGGGGSTEGVTTGAFGSPGHCLLVCSGSGETKGRGKLAL
ncbi:Sickle tail protein [Liparis tanakae]|uniref:Sickle tail protein n=1 Tax=Liparis tanakae TaxID=230148 RepID=A0A4Z2I7W4_9TELE|nr:Sickle tail protein [Liparis tanakae]